MNKIKIQNQKLDEHVDVLDLAKLTHAIWKITKPELNATIEGIENWIKNLDYDEVPIIAKAYEDELLVGWVLLFVHDTKRLEINPWALGGHPHISLNQTNITEIAQLLLKECINYALQNNHTRIELCYEKKVSAESYPIDPFTYTKCDLNEEDEIVFMSLNLEIQDVSELEFPEVIDMILLKDADEGELYSCFSDSFSESGDRNFLSQTAEERKEYFNERFDKSDRIEEASIALVKENKIIGFTSVARSTHGEVNGHLWLIGVVPKHQGCHLGSKLLNHAIVTLKQQEYKSMSLAVDSANERAVKLYEKFNFIKGWRRITHAWKGN